MSAIWLGICYGLLLYGFADCTSCTSNSDCSSDLLQCNDNSLMCEPVSCTQNGDCTMANTTCQGNTCTCSDGNTEWNGQCTHEWKPLISVKHAYQDDIPFIQFICGFETNDDYTYKIKWTNQDESILYETGLLPASEARDFVLNETMVVNSIIIDVNTKFVCGVSQQPTTQEQLQYSEPFIPLEIVETNIQMMRGQDAVIEIKKNFPFACNKGIDCFLEFLVYDPYDSNACTNSTVVVKSNSTCGQRIRGVKSTQEEVVTKETIGITLTTQNNNKYKLKDNFSLKLKTIVKGQEEHMFTGEFQSIITLLVEDDAFWKRTYCYATNDPRMITFDRVSYEIQSVDEFKLFRHKRTEEEIQMMTMSCNGGWASCSCGVAVRAGRDVFVINHCNGVHITGFILHEDNILDVREVTQNNYHIILPHGTSVKVLISPRRGEHIVNIYIFPSPSDVGQIEGLCGNLNGDYQDNFIHKDGTTETTTNYKPDDFSRSWGLVSQNVWASESLLNVDEEPTIYQRLDSYPEDKHLCVCPNGHTSSEARCSANEEDTCTSTVHHRGTKINFQTCDFVQILRKLRNKRKDLLEPTVTENPNAITYGEAWALCTAYMQQSCLNITLADDGTTKIIDSENITKDCARDKMINTTFDWEKLACVTVQVIVQNEVEKDTEYQAANPVSTDKTNKTCIGNCNDHGNCVDGKCNCSNGFAGEECTISTSAAPEISYIQGNGTCDKKLYHTCDCISVTSNGFVKKAHCKICVNKSEGPGPFTVGSCATVSAKYQSYNIIQCCLPSSRRKKRDTSGNFAEIYNISTSNDEINFGDATLVLVLDTTCQNITTDSNGNYVASLLDGYCFIGGSCYADGSSSSSNSCDVCETTTDTLSWSTKINC